MTLRFGLVAKPLNLLGRPGATINAKGQTPLKVGPVTLPGSVGIAVPDTWTTGILVGSASPILVQIRNNVIRGNHYGIFLEGTGPVVHATLYGNRLRNVSVHVKRVIAP